MRKNRRLLNGDLLTLEVPDADALPGSTAISVLSLDGQELELNSGTAGDLEFYLSISGSELTGEAVLRDGTTLRYGRYGGDPDSGFAFSVTVGEHEVYGFTVPAMDVEALTSYLASVAFESGAEGPVLTLSGPVGWSQYRTHTVAQVVDLPAGEGFLMDIRRTRTDDIARENAGVEVDGGWLTRSSEQERHAYAVLEASDFVTYGIPGEQGDLDQVATVLSGTTTELG